MSYPVFKHIQQFQLQESENPLTMTHDTSRSEVCSNGKCIFNWTGVKRLAILLLEGGIL